MKPKKFSTSFHQKGDQKELADNTQQRTSSMNALKAMDPSRQYKSDEFAKGKMLSLSDHNIRD